MDLGNIVSCFLGLLILNCDCFYIEVRDHRSEYSAHPDSDCPGNDAWGGFTMSSLSQCQQFCDDHAECVAFAYKDTYAEHSCWPKDKCEQLTTNYLGWSIYKKVPVPTSGCGYHATFDATPGYALYGYDDEVLVNTSEPVCARRCMMKGDQCLSFDYNNCTSTCYLSSESKDTVVTFARNRHMTYYHKNCTRSEGEDNNPDTDDDDDGDDVYPGISGSGEGDIEIDSNRTDDSSTAVPDTDDEEETGGCRFMPDAGHALYGHNDHVYRETSLELCTALCTEDSLCMSFDFSHNTGSCFISYSSKTIDPLDYGTHSTLTYYHKMCNLTEPTSEGDSAEEGTTEGDSDEGPNGEEESSDGSEISGSGDFTSDNEDDGTTGEGQPCIKILGPYGGSGGSQFSDRSIFIENYRKGTRISQIQINHSSYIHCIGFTYGSGGEAVVGPCHGGTGGTKDTIDLQPEEYVTGMKGRYGTLIDQVTVVTNQREHGPYGGFGGRPFGVSGNGAELAFISGRSGNLVDQLKLHFYCQSP